MRPSRNRGGGRGGARSCSVSVVFSVFCSINVNVGRHLLTRMCRGLGLQLDLLV